MSDVSINDVTAVGTPFRIGSALSKTFSVLGGSPGSFLLLALIPLTPVLVIKIMASAGPASVRFGWLGGVAGIATFLLGIVAQAITLYAAYQQMGGKPFSVAQSLSAGLGRCFPVIGVALLSSLGIGIASLFFLIPGLMVYCALYVAVPACVIEKTAVFDSINRSSDLTKGYRWQIFGLILLVYIVSFIILILFGWFGGVTLWGGLPYFAWQVVTTAFSAVLAAVVYHDLRVAKEGIDVDSLALVFD
ncbi:conserved hypothetical protein; putative permease of the major falicitator superfamily [Bradyrhizobium sp. ORS 278]|uniref:hypothetical protein n=1 Tax=Bradyrhizobium sp. (strain ORS 278) TaxID=114615 RepID=UPI0001508D88|nr:hypothetical protein [Bradyrhizobium sp. ORS 278]CAL78008.1 conserved hypothetical protein; putative permease of the major falicitator superfamily [Bradyrhizobium sp. ORS 278]